MLRIRRQEGSGLIVLLGIMATLAILATIVVMVTVNSQADTAATRTQTKSFTLAQAGLNFATYALDAAWPTSSATQLNTTTIAQNVLAQFPSSTYPGTSVTVHLYDNSDTNSDGVIGYTPSAGWDAGWDANGDGIMWADVEATVGKGILGAETTRLREEVSSTSQSGGLAANPTVLWTAGQVRRTAQHRHSRSASQRHRERLYRRHGDREQRAQRRVRSHPRPEQLERADHRVHADEHL